MADSEITPPREVRTSPERGAPGASLAEMVVGYKIRIPVARLRGTYEEPRPAPSELEKVGPGVFRRRR